MKAQLLFSFMMSGCMALIMSGTMTFLHVGMDPLFFAKWLRAFSIAYAIAFPLVLILAPLLRKVSLRLTQ